MRRLFFVLALALPLFASAQRLNVYKGDYEVAGSGSFDLAQLGMDLRFGAFIRNYLQIGGNVEWLDTDSLTRSYFGGYALHLYETRTYLLPYIGAGLGLGSLEADSGFSESGLELSFFFGMKYFLTDNVAVNTEVRLGLSSADTYLSDDRAESNDIAVRIGLSYLW